MTTILTSTANTGGGSALDGPIADLSRLDRSRVLAGGVIVALAWLSIAMGPSVVSPYPLMVLLPAFTIGLPPRWFPRFSWCAFPVLGELP
jgi:hypothetical protein